MHHLVQSQYRAPASPQLKQVFRVEAELAKTISRHRDLLAAARGAFAAIATASTSHRRHPRASNPDRQRSHRPPCSATIPIVLLSDRAELVALDVFTRAQDAGQPFPPAMVERRLDELRFARQVGQGPLDSIDIEMADVDPASIHGHCAWPLCGRATRPIPPPPGLPGSAYVNAGPRLQLRT